MLAINEVNIFQNQTPKVIDGAITLPEFPNLDNPMCGKLKLSKEAVAVTVNTIKQGAAASNLTDAMEMGYQGFGEIACISSSKEGILVFLEKRTPQFE